MMRDFTFDTGMLIALSRRKSAAWRRVDEIEHEGRAITIPTVTIAEFWRGRTDQAERVLRLRGVTIEPLSAHIARRAGEALAELGGDARIDAKLTIDAIVMASAAEREDIVLTSDVDDLTRFENFFPDVVVLRF